MKQKVKTTEIVLPELSFEVMGALFEVFRNIGYGHREKYYHRSIIEEFKRRGINFQHEAPTLLNYKGKVVGKDFIDFLIDNQIILEIKTKRYFTREDFKQVKEYLVAMNLKLGILASFAPSGVTYKRVLNSRIS